MTQTCSEHSNVMQCLGKLEANSERNYNSLISLHQKFDGIKDQLSNGKVASAAEKAKSGILYWALAAAGLLLISRMGDKIFKAIGL